MAASRREIRGGLRGLSGRKIIGQIAENKPSAPWKTVDHDVPPRLE